MYNLMYVCLSKRYYVCSRVGIVESKLIPDDAYIILYVNSECQGHVAQIQRIRW